MAERRSHRGRWIAGITAACVVVAGGIGIPVAIAAATPGADYRTATVGHGTVTQALQLSGSVQRVNQVTASFAGSATVTGVDVTVGQMVTAGQKLAGEDPTALQAALLSAQATLAKQQAALAADDSAPASAAVSASPAAAAASAQTGAESTAPVSASSSRGTQDPVPAVGASSPSTTEVKADLVTAEGALAAVRRDLDAAQQLCEALVDTHAPSSHPSTAEHSDTGTAHAPVVTPTTSPTPNTTPTATPTPIPTSTSTPMATPTPAPTTTPAPPDTSGGTGAEAPTAQQVTACEGALRTAADALQSVTQSLTSIAAQLEAAVSVPSASSATAPSSGGSRGIGRTNASTASGTADSPGGTAGRSPSATRGAQSGGTQSGGAQSQASRVAADQVAVLQAQQAVTQAQTNVDGATLTAPISGRVGAITLVKGQTASPSEGITIVGPGAATVTVQVPLSAMSSVHAGQNAEVTAAGATTPIVGTVQTVGLLPATTSSTTPTYPATVLVTTPTAAMPSGAQAAVTITVGTAADALRVPVSALSGRTGQSASVVVLSGHGATRTPVTIGAVGGGWVQVLDGVQAGQSVVLADASQALPTNTTGLGGLGGFGRGGFGRQRAGRAG